MKVSKCPVGLCNTSKDHNLYSKPVMFVYCDLYLIIIQFVVLLFGYPTCERNIKIKVGLKTWPILQCSTLTFVRDYIISKKNYLR